MRRFEGGLVLAFRLELARPRKEGHRIAVVDLDEDYLPVGAPLVIEPAMVRDVHHPQEGALLDLGRSSPQDVRTVPGQSRIRGGVSVESSFRAQGPAAGLC